MSFNQKLMMNPVINSIGNTYEKTALEEYLIRNPVDYLTQEKIALDKIMPNLALKNSIAEFLNENPWAFDFKENDSAATIIF